uniref:ZP domain-containing protein n=1 Tax=Bos indicus x Bos taurus TaxID=30522 RepID=A0A4W2HES3_BOBOX
MTTRGSITTSSMNNSAALGITEYSSTTSAPSNSGRDNGPAVPSNASSTTGRTTMSESQQHSTPVTLLTSSPTGSSAGSTEQTSPTHETQEEKLNTVISTTSEGTTLPNSMMTSRLKAQGGPSRSTASSSMATTAKPSKQNQSAPAAAPFTSSCAANGLESSVAADSSKLATITTPMALNTSGIDLTSSGSTTTTVSEMSATISRATLDKTTDAIESSPVTTRVVTHTTSLTVTTLETTVPGTSIPGAQEGVTTAAPFTLTTSSTISTESERHHNTIMQTPSSPMESAPSAGTAMTPSPGTTAAHSTPLTPISPGTTKSSARTGVSQVSPRHTGSSSPGAEICALDEYLADSGGCMCNNSYYAHSELSGALVALRCQTQKIEVVLSSCFLKTRHWILGKGAFSGCSSVSKSEEGRRAQVFTVEKKEGSCGLHLSINKSHALYSLEAQLLKSHPDAANKTDIMMLSLIPFHQYITIHILGTGDTIVILGIYTDPQCLSPLENRPAPLHKPLYVVLRATSSDPNRFALVVNEVFASTSISRTGAVKATHYFVKKSCPVSKRLLEGPRANGASLEVKLAFNPFRLLPSDVLYLHSRVTLCDKQAGRPCPPVSGQNRAWEIATQEGRESGTGWLVFGPIRLSGNWIIWGPPWLLFHISPLTCSEMPTLSPLPTILFPQFQSVSSSLTPLLWRDLLSHPILVPFLTH